MGEIINLRRVRKARDRADQAEKADANRIAFGRTKADHQLAAATSRLESKRLEGHKLEPDTLEEPSPPNRQQGKAEDRE